MPLSLFSKLRKRKRDESDELEPKAKKVKKVFEACSSVGYQEDNCHSVHCMIPYKTEDLQDLVSRELVSFLNTNGGILCFGARPTGIVCGVKVNRKKEDALKIAIDEVVKRIHPMVKPGMYRMTFTPVVDHRGRETQSFVLEIRVAKGDTFQLYETGGSDPNFKVGKRESQVFLREGSIFSKPLTPHQIKIHTCKLLKEKLSHQASLAERLKTAATASSSTPPPDVSVVKTEPGRERDGTVLKGVKSERSKAFKPTTETDTNSSKFKPTTETDTSPSRSKPTTETERSSSRSKSTVDTKNNSKPTTEIQKSSSASSTNSDVARLAANVESEECPLPDVEPRPKKKTSKITALVASIRKSVKQTFSTKSSQSKQPAPPDVGVVEAETAKEKDSTVLRDVNTERHKEDKEKKAKEKDSTVLKDINTERPKEKKASLPPPTQTTRSWWSRRPKRYPPPEPVPNSCRPERYPPPEPVPISHAQSYSDRNTSIPSLMSLPLPAAQHEPYQPQARPPPPPFNAHLSYDAQVGPISNGHYANSWKDRGPAQPYSLHQQQYARNHYLYGDQWPCGQY